MNTPISHLSLKSDDLRSGLLESIPKQPRVCIIGAGLSGIAAGVQLKRQLGVENFVIFEAKNGFGGTWSDNVYWGAAVDIPTTFYSFSFAPSSSWIHNYSRQPELKLYAETVANKYNLLPHLISRTKVEKLVWNKESNIFSLFQTKESNTYTVTTQDQRKDGLKKEWTFDFVICGVGQLNVPSYPDIKGLDTFEGDMFHSARWNEGISLEGKKVLVIGIGATAAQFVPEVAKVAGDLKVFARSQNWILKRDEYVYSDLHKFALSYVPGVRLYERFAIWFLADFVLWFAFMKKKWMVDVLEGECRKHMKNMIPGDDEKSVAVREMLTPDYPWGCRRVQFSNTLAKTFMRPNTAMITSPILRIAPTGIVTSNPDGSETLHEGDVLILGTGFKTHDFLGTLEVIDADGKKLGDRWNGLGGAEAYYGIMVSGLPNLFMCYGPNTNLGHSSIIYMIECQVNFAIRAIGHLQRRGKAAVSLTHDAQDKFNEKLRSELGQLSWSGACRSWYKTADGKIENNWSGRTYRYANETASVNFDSAEFELLGKNEWRTSKGGRSWVVGAAVLAAVGAGAYAVFKNFRN